MNYRDRQSELDAFKRLNLTVIASEHGYQIDRKKRTPHTALMKSGNDKIIVSKKDNNHYVYCSVHDTTSNGTLVDFAQKIIEPNCSLGRVRQLLRPYLNGSYFSSIQKKNKGNFAPIIRSSNTDIMAVAARYSGFKPILKYHPYLCGERGIPVELLQQDRLKGRVMYCPRKGSIIFPHWGSPDGNAENRDRCITGYEIKGEGVNLFSKGGRKGLWCSSGFWADKHLVFAESAIDALSYLALSQKDDARVVSVSGQINPTQIDLMKSAIAKMRAGSNIVAAFDNDLAGQKLTEELKNLVAEFSDNMIHFVQSLPPYGCVDWNNSLLKSKLEHTPSETETQNSLHL